MKNTLLITLFIISFLACPLYADIIEIGDDSQATGSIYTINESYSLARKDTTTGTASSENIISGQQFFDETNYYVFRGTLRFDTSALPDDAFINSAQVVIVAETRHIEYSFSLSLVEGTFTGETVVADWFNEFDGWAESGAYSVTLLANTISTLTFANDDSLYFTLNSAGINTINKTGNTSFMLLSDRDINETEPTGTEYVEFVDSAPYIKIWYNLQLEETRYLSKNGKVTRKILNGSPTRLKKL